MNFKETIENLKANNSTPIVTECLQTMTNDEVLFNGGFVQEKEKLSNLYLLRLNMSKDLNRDKFEDDEIENWEIAVDNLMKSPSEELKLSWVSSEKKTYLLFWDNQTKKLQAIYYLYSKSSIAEQEINNDKIIEQGFTVSSVKFINGKRIKDWKKNS
ncbi:hypothetical protein [Pseudofulvibacter geojedonensis]|uniref:Uncharacterized protein n=1 Tax=Pseudofulvibacter geojedonensis TaxID=1123758 RepID=A0ABW3I5T5_9FLAO